MRQIRQVYKNSTDSQKADLSFVKLKTATLKRRFVGFKSRLKRFTYGKAVIDRLNLFDGMAIVLVVVSAYLLAAPMVPLIEYHLRDHFDIGYDEGLVEGAFTRATGGRFKADLPGDQVDEPKGDRIVIPAIGVDMPIIEGRDDSALDRGSWLRPNTAKPGEVGNTVLTAHRFSYLSGGRSFYNLDKLDEGDEIIVHWGGKEYRYTAKQEFVVTPDQIEIEAPTANTQLTLYTCTPLWTSSKRLVVVAEPTPETLELVGELP